MPVVGCDGVSGGQAVSGPISDVGMDGKCPSLPSRGIGLFVQPGGEGRPGRGRAWGLQENQLPALPGFPQQGVHPQVLTTQPATSVLTQAHRTQHPHCCKTTHTFKVQTHTREAPVSQFTSDTKNKLIASICMGFILEVTRRVVNYVPSSHTLTCVEVK